MKIIDVINEEILDFLNQTKFKSNKKYYHYSDNLFTKFKGQNDIDYERKHSVINRGIYFHDTPPMVKYGKNKYEVLLDIKNRLLLKFLSY